MAELTIIELGRRDYAPMAAAQERLVAARLDDAIGDTLLLLEHPPTYTLGKRSEPSDLLHDETFYRERGMAICETPRGGKVTYHGPGQLVAYPIVDLRGIGTQPAGADRVDVAGFVGDLEEAMGGALACWGLPAGRIEGLTGLWIDDARDSRQDFTGAKAVDAAPGLARGSIRKIGSIGLKVTQGVTSHGLSLNVSGDLTPFEWINSCGIESCRPTSIAAELGGEGPSISEAGGKAADRLAAELGLEPLPGDGREFGLDRPGRADSVA